MSRVNRHPPVHSVNQAAYDAEAEATGWLGPEIAFALMHSYLVPGQAVLEIGIGTGLAAMLFHKAWTLIRPC